MTIEYVASSGLILPLSEQIIKDLKIDFDDYSEEIQYYKNQNMDNLSAIENVISDEKEILVYCTINHKRIQVCIFRYEEELGGELDVIEDGWYLLFKEKDLYTKTLNSTGQFLKDNDYLPLNTNWIIPS